MIKLTIKVVCLVLVLLLAFYWLVVLSYRHSTRNQEFEYGVSFSTKYAQELGIDPQKAYLALIDDLGFKKIRLMSYWDLHELQIGQYDFADLDWQIEQASSRNVDVTLVVGIKQPRYPDCHLPSWADDLSEERLNSETNKYIHTVVERYANRTAIEAWQLENEPRDSILSACKPDYDANQLQTEFDIIRELDPYRPINMTLSTEHQLPISGPIGDKVGYSIYNEVNMNLFGKRMQWEHLIPSSWHSFKSGVIALTKDRETYIHELQAEPWGKVPTADLTQEEMARTMSPQKLLENLDYAKDTGNKLIYFWGAEWWYWQKTVNERPEMWNEVSAIIKN